eukprot:SAG31_NODE_6017_length_2213_cov_1.150426_2_plen_237_part_00
MGVDPVLRCQRGCLPTCQANFDRPDGALHPKGHDTRCINYVVPKYCQVTQVSEAQWIRHINGLWLPIEPFLLHSESVSETTVINGPGSGYLVTGSKRQPDINKEYIRWDRIETEYQKPSHNEQNKSSDSSAIASPIYATASLATDQRLYLYQFVLPATGLLHWGIFTSLNPLAMDGNTGRRVDGLLAMQKAGGHGPDFTRAEWRTLCGENYIYEPSLWVLTLFTLLSIRSARKSSL